MVNDLGYLIRVLPNIKVQQYKKDDSIYLLMRLHGYQRPFAIEIVKGISFFNIIVHGIIKITQDPRYLELFGYTCIINDVVYDFSEVCKLSSFDPTPIM